MKVVARFKERIQVRKLRREGFSIGNIAKKVGVAKSTASLWCRDISLTDEQIYNLAKRESGGSRLGALRASENRRRERMSRLGRFMGKGALMVGELNKRDIFLVGAALYWAEGDKKQRRVGFCNSDPKMINLWLSWLKLCLGVPEQDFKCVIGINDVHKYRIGDVEKYWSKTTGIKLSQFGKPSYKHVKNKKVYENFEDHFGTLMVRIKRSTNLNYRILGMIEALGRPFEAKHGKI